MEESDVDGHSTVTLAEIDEKRHQTVAYEYLCHLEEAKIWMEAVIKETLPPTTEMEEGLRNGVSLAKLANVFAPEIVPLRKIYDPQLLRYNQMGLHFKHTDNITKFLQSAKHIGLAGIFLPETTDIYDRKNIPRLIYCLHALSIFLYKKGITPCIQNLVGTANFTESEITTMANELSKYGIPMPQFKKIGGILANDLKVDEAALHASIIAINTAVEQQLRSDIMQALQNPAAQVRNLDLNLDEHYQLALQDELKIKKQNLLNKSLSDSYTPDVYDELLNQFEIQNCVTETNRSNALDEILKTVDNDDADGLIKMLTRTNVWKDVIDENKKEYLTYLANNNNRGTQLDIRDIQFAIHAVNTSVAKDRERVDVVQAINKALLMPNQRYGFINHLRKCPVFVEEFALSLYLQEMSMGRDSLERDLTWEEICNGVNILTCIANITTATDSGNVDKMWNALCKPAASLERLDKDNKLKYMNGMRAVRNEKLSLGEECALLTHMDVQDIIDVVNIQSEGNRSKIVAIQQLNLAVTSNDKKELQRLLSSDLFEMKDTSKRDIELYMMLLQDCLKSKQSEHSELELWYEDVEEVGSKVNQHVSQAEQECAAMAILNKAVQTCDCNKVNKLLSKYPFINGYNDMLQSCKKEYYDRLVSELDLKQSDASNSPWISHCLSPSKREVFCNMETLEFVWDRPEEYVLSGKFFNSKEIIRILHRVTSSYHLSNTLIQHEQSIIKLQAHVRGFLLRKRLESRLTMLASYEKEIVLIQSWWRGVMTRRKINELMAKGKPKRRDTWDEKMDYYKQKENHIIKIQSVWRSYRTRKALVSLLHSDTPPLAFVRWFIHLLDISDNDMEEELQLQVLKDGVVQTIRRNSGLESELDNMDIKIGLLVQNRITVQSRKTSGDLKKQTKCHTPVSFTKSLPRGLQALNKCSKDWLDAYQHLFYHLQTQPHYLSKILFSLPQSKTNKFIADVVLSLFNYGANLREEYLLLKLFKTALKEEIWSKVDNLSDVITGDPLVLKMVLSYNRNEQGQSSLREVLDFPITKVLEDKSIFINTNPVDIYKSWIIETETRTGKPSTLPYTVTQDEALQHEEVKQRLRKSLAFLKQWTNRFLMRILQCRDCIPYGLLYIAKTLRKCLKEKFPNALEKDVLKVVGNLLYYRFINPAIVAPDAFDIVMIHADQPITNAQRRNLGCIAKILQFAASKRGFGEESPHLVILNSYIVQCHEKFKTFFMDCCEVDEPEDHYNIDQYSEAALIAKPTVYISLQEICDTHKLLLEHENAIAPERNDPLHYLLADLGTTPSIGALIGNENLSEDMLATLARKEVCLTLSNKFQVSDEGNKPEAEKLLIQTRQMLVAALPFIRGSTLVECLSSQTTATEEESFSKSQGRRQRQDEKAQNKTTVLGRSSSFLSRSVTLQSCKSTILNNLNQLELYGRVTKKDGYQAMVTSLAKAVINSRGYRCTRKMEIQKLKMTKQNLEKKTKFYQDQKDYYNKYIQTCLDNLSAGKKKSSKKSKSHASKCIKYSAARLHEKGVVLEIEGLPLNQFRNVLFEFTPCEESGVFEINARFMGVAMEHVTMNIQELLQLQFDGVSVMNVFEKAKINVNLLLFLLNSKFYKKSK